MLVPRLQEIRKWVDCVDWISACELSYIFDVKMEDFRRKGRLVAGGHVTDPPATTTYASVVSRYKVVIDLSLSVLNNLPVKVVDIQNSYILAPVTEKIWTVLGPGFFVDAGRKATVVYYLFGLKSARASFWNHLENCMHHFGFLPCPANLDLCIKPMVSPNYGFNYYAYVLIYVYDVIVIHHDAESVLRIIYKYFKLTPSLIGDPDIYLGDNLNKIRLEKGVWSWANSPSRYVKESMANFDKYLAELADTRCQLPKKKY